MKKPELVCPAGDWASLTTAVDSGADAVYFGIKSINMRARAKNFDLLEIPKVMEFLHQNNKKGYLALNVIVMNHELEKVKTILQKAKDANVDAVVLWDMAVFSMAKELGLKVHLSTQASVSNSKALEFFSSLGASRIVLARECSLEQIKQIVQTIDQKNIPCQVEAFIHGAMCVSISGRCFLSSFSFGTSANKGECQQPCRREFSIKDTDDESEYILGHNYVLSPKDLCSIDFIDQLIEAGIHSFKIEGRMRSVEYIKLVVSSYRNAIDAYFNKELTDPLKQQLKEEVEKVYNRKFSTGFYFGQPKEWNTKDFEKSYDKIFLGDIVKFYKKIMVAEIFIRNQQLKEGDRILVIGKTTPASFCTAKELQVEHQYVKEVKKGEPVGVKLPFTVKRNDKVFLWKKRE
jgi:putative protease